MSDINDVATSAGRTLLGELDLRDDASAIRAVFRVLSIESEAATLERERLRAKAERELGRIERKRQTDLELVERQLAAVLRLFDEEKPR